MNVDEVINKSSRSDAQWENLNRELLQLKTQNEKLTMVNDIFEELVRAVAVRLPAEKPPELKLKERKPVEEKVVLELSDAQIGSYVSKYMTGGLANYNKLEFVKRIKLLTEKILDIVEIQRGGGIPIRQLNIHVLGDMVQGENVFPGQGYQLDALLLEQALFLANRMVEEIFVPLSRIFERVEIFCIPGNHGKQGRPGDSSRMANWDFVTYLFWKFRMEKIEHVKFFISASPFLIYELFPRQVHALIHGNQAKGWMGYPYYGVDRLYHRLTALSGIYIQFLHHGHHHQPSMQDTHIGKKIGNGSIEGGSEYSVCDLVTANVPQQLLCAFSAKRMTWQYWLELAEAPRLKLDDNKIFTPLMGDVEKEALNAG